jgi:DNA-binding NarL/FixJ family response regulator
MLEVMIMAPAQRRRDWLQHVLDSKTHVRLAGVTASFPYLRSLLDEHAADVVIVDLESMSNLESARDWILELQDLLPIVLLCPDTAAVPPRRLMRSRAVAILRADAAADQILLAVEAACSGLIVLDPGAVPGAEPQGERVEELTSREGEVLQLLAEGFANREIARRLDISEHTIKFHIQSILGKLRASTRTEAVARGFRAGLIEW